VDVLPQVNTGGWSIQKALGMLAIVSQELLIAAAHTPFKG
jgi:hypothetical protein